MLEFLGLRGRCISARLNRVVSPGIASYVVNPENLIVTDDVEEIAVQLPG
jgi:hypothetical protein